MSSHAYSSLLTHYFFYFFLLLLLGDRFRVEHVIINFLSNAVKFSPDGAEIIIQISERNPHSEVREEPRKLPEGPVLRPHKGGLKERDGRAAMWSRSSSFVDKDRKYLILSYLILSYLILSLHHILSYLIVSYLILSYLILSYLKYFILSYLIVSYLIL